MTRATWYPDDAGLSAGTCPACGTPTTGAACVTCGQRLDAHPLAVRDYHDLTAPEADPDWGWT